MGSKKEKGENLGSQPWAGIRDHKPWNPDQQFLEVRLYHFVGSATKAYVTVLESRIRNVSTKMGSAIKNIPRVI